MPNTAEDSPGDENRKVVGQGVPERSHGKEDRGENQKSFAPKTIAQRPGHQCANETANERTTVRPGDLGFGVQLEVSWKKGLAPPMTTQSQPNNRPAHRGHDRDQPDITQNYNPPSGPGVSVTVAVIIMNFVMDRSGEIKPSELPDRLGAIQRFVCVVPVTFDHGEAKLSKILWFSFPTANPC